MFSSDYGFCKFRIPQIGGRVIWEVTNECNYGCKYCIFASTGRKPEGELTTKEIFSTIDELYLHSFQYIKFTGGEPFLREDMIDILEYAKAKGMKCDISTNASRITDDIAQRLKILNLEMVHVSIDGATQDQHEAVRGKKSFHPTLNGINLLIKHDVKVRIGCVIHEFNEYHLKEMIQFCESIKIQELIFSMMEPVGRLRGKTTGLAKRQIQDIIQKIAILSQEASIKVSHNLHSHTIQPITLYKELPSQNSLKNCPGGTKFLFINSVGLVSPCTWVSEKKPDWIHEKIKDFSLSEILYSDGFKKLYELSENHPAQCPVNHE